MVATENFPKATFYFGEPISWMRLILKGHWQNFKKTNRISEGGFVQPICTYVSGGCQNLLLSLATLLHQGTQSCLTTPQSGRSPWDWHALGEHNGWTKIWSWAFEAQTLLPSPGLSATFCKQATFWNGPHPGQIMGRSDNGRIENSCTVGWLPRTLENVGCVCVFYKEAVFVYSTNWMISKPAVNGTHTHTPVVGVNLLLCHCLLILSTCSRKFSPRWDAQSENTNGKMASENQELDWFCSPSQSKCVHCMRNLAVGEEDPWFDGCSLALWFSLTVQQRRELFNAIFLWLAKISLIANK